MRLHDILLAKAFGGGGGSGAIDITGCTPNSNLRLSSLKSFAIVSEDATSIGGNAFINCTNLTSVDLPVAESIGEGAFYGCTALASVDLPVAESIGDWAFYQCTSLASVDLPNVTDIGEYAFNHCTALASVDIHNAESIGAGAFVDCTPLTSVDLPVAKSIGRLAFSNCTPLTSVDLPVAESIGEACFHGCTNLNTLIIRNENAACELNFTAIINTGILTEEGAPTGTGFLYVPAKFYEDYLAMATMQAAYLLMSQGMGEAEAQATAAYIASVVIRKIEDYPEICG